MKIKSMRIGIGVALLMSCSALGQSTMTDGFADNRQTRREVGMVINESNQAATKETGEPSFCGSNPGKSVWLRWQPPSDGVVDIRVTGEGFQPLVGLYTGKTLTELRANRSVCSSTNRLLVTVFSSDTYEIAIAGENDRGGNFTLNLSLITAPLIEVQSVDREIVIGEPVQFTVAALGLGAPVPSVGGSGNPEPLKYQWTHAGTNLIDGLKLDGTRVGGATTPTLTLNNVQDGWEGAFTLGVNNRYGQAIDEVKLSLGSGPKIIEQPRDQLVSGGGRGTFNVVAVGKEPLSYLWQFEGGADAEFQSLGEGGKISGSRTSALAVSSATSAEEGKYRVIVSNLAGSATSAPPAKLTVDIGDLVIADPPKDLTKAEGESASFSVRADVRSQTFPRPVPTYQWQFNGANLAESGRYSGTASSALTVRTLTIADAGKYTVLVSIPGASKTVSANLTVLQVPVNDNYASRTILPLSLLISTNGYNFGATSEANEKFHVGEAPARSVWWAWTVPTSCSLATVSLNGSGLAGRLAIYEGGALIGLQDARNKRAAADQLTFYAAGGTEYAIAVDGRNGAVGDIKLNVSYTTNVPAPAIRRDCPDGIFLACDPCKFSVEVESIAPVSFKWQRVEVAGGQTNFIDLDPVKYPTTVTRLSPPSSTPELLEMTIPSGQPSDEGFYRIVLENCGGVANSRIAKLELRKPPEIRRQPADIMAVRECSQVRFDVEAAGCKPFVYQWRFNGLDLPGQTSASLAFASATTNEMGRYSVVVQNSLGAVTSRVAQLTINPVPRITVHPQGKDVRSCVDYAFSVTADDSCNRPLFYRWLFNGTNLTRTGIATTNRDLKLVNVQTNEAGAYSVIVSSAGGAVTSQVGRLVVHAGPWITNQLAQPADQGKLKIGDGFTLRVGVESCTPVQYQWFFSGVTNPPLLSAWYPYANPNQSSVEVLRPTGGVSVQPIFIETNRVQLTNLTSATGERLILTNYLVRTNNPITLTNLSLIPGATGPALTLSNVAPAQSGFYLVTVTNLDRWTNSRLARATVYVPPPNDSYANRISIPGTNGTVTSYNLYATRETNEPIHAPGTVGERSVWWTWTAPDDAGFLSVDLSGSSFRTLLALYTNAPADGKLTQFARAGSAQTSSASRLVDIGLTDRTTVQIAVDGANNEEGNVQLKLAYAIDRRPPVITRQPASIAVKKDARITFEVAFDNPFAGYQWMFAPDRRPSSTNQIPSDVTLVPIPGASGTVFAPTKTVTLSLANIAEKDEGYYVVVLTNKYGLVRSEAGRLTLGGVIRGLVTDATNGRGIPLARVGAGDPTLGPANFVTTLTDANGNYELFGLKPGTLRADFYADRLVVGLNQAVNFSDQSTFKEILLTGAKTNYYDYLNNQVEITEGGGIQQAFAMSPALLQGMRLILNWGDSPADLDAHLVTPFVSNGRKIEVNPGDKGALDRSPFATQDYDVRNGRGPETVTIRQFASGTYRFYVTKFRASDAGTLPSSLGVVNIYTNRPAGDVDQKSLYEIHAPQIGDGLYWHVCDIDGDTRTLTIVNKYVNSSPALLQSNPSEPVELPDSQPVRKRSEAGLMSRIPDYVTRSWILGDNLTDTGSRPSPKYGSPGYKTITLKLTDERQTPPYASQLVRTNYILVTNDPPRVRIISPQPEQLFHMGPGVLVKAVATDSDSALAQVALYQGAERLAATLVQKSTNLWEAEFSWPTTKDGRFPITATVTDVFGATNEAPVVAFRVTNEAPTIRLLAPRPGQLFRLNGTIDLIADAQDADSPIAKVEFLQDGRLVLAMAAPSNVLQWRAATNRIAVVEGNFKLSAKVTDIFGATGMTEEITIRVRDLTGDVLIVQNQADPEIEQLIEYISEIRYWDEGLRDYRQLVTRVLDQEGLNYSLAETFKLIIWHDLGSLGLTTNDAAVFHQAFANGQPLYLIGEKLATSSESLAEPYRSSWINLTQLKPGTSRGGLTNIVLRTDNPPHRIFPTPWPNLTSFAYPNSLEISTITTNRIVPRPPGLVFCAEPVETATDTEVMGKWGDAHVLIFGPSQYVPDYGSVRTVTQNFQVTNGNDADSLDARKYLFKYATSWLLRNPPCSSLDLDLSAEATVETAETGQRMTYTLRLLASGECDAEGVVVTSALPANVCFQSADCGSGAWRYEGGIVTFLLGHLERGATALMNVTLVPKTSAVVSIRTLASANGREAREDNNSFLLEIPVTGSPKDCPQIVPPLLRVQRIVDRNYELLISNLAGGNYALQTSANLTAWTTITNFAATGASFLFTDRVESQAGQRFYRVVGPPR